MEKAVEFVSGAIGKSSSVEDWKRFHIRDNRILAKNGVITMSAPFPLDFVCSVDAAQFKESLKRCKESIAITLMPSNRLRVLSGKFRSFVDTVVDANNVYNMVDIGGEYYDINGEAFLHNAKRLLPFISNDEVRYYLTGIFVSKGKMVATNGNVLLECEQAETLPVDANIPKDVIIQLLKTKDAPNKVQISKKAIAFHYDDGKVISSQLLEGNFPAYERILSPDNGTPELHPEFWEGVQAISNMSDIYNRIFIYPNCLRTTREGDDGAQYDIEGLVAEDLINAIIATDNRLCFSSKLLSALVGVATRIDFSGYVKDQKSVFFGEGCRGAIMGMRG